MKELTIISGKGGTGKTSIVASFAALAKSKVIADADVDAADLHLILAPVIQYEEDFRGGHTATIHQDICTACGECIARCQFNAIASDFKVDRIDCEGCGVCVSFCPVDAIAFPQNICGKWYISETRFGPLAHAKLGIAEENSGRLVTLVRNQAKRIAEERQLDLVIIDGPPGIGCPVIAATTGASTVLIVTEPTLSGLHDLDRVGHLAAFFKIPTLVCINKYDLNPDMANQIEDYAKRQKMHLMGRIPYDRTFTHAMVEGKSIVEFSDGNTAEAIRELWSHVEDFLNKPK